MDKENLEEKIKNKGMGQDEDAGKTMMHERSLIGYIRKASAYAVICIATALYMCGCGDDGGGSTPPTARLSVSAPVGAKPHKWVVLDASGSTAGSSLITKVDFDFDGDGIIDYSESAIYAPDGNFDMIAVASYPNEGDYTPTVTVTDSEWLEGYDFGDIDVGYGDDSAGAYIQAEGILSNEGYACTQDQNFQLFNPITLKMTAYTGLKAEMSDSILYIIYDWDSMTNEQKDTINTRAAQGINDPSVVVVRRTDSPDTIDSMLAGH